MAFYLMLFVLVSLTAFCCSRTRDRFLAADLRVLCFLLMLVPAALRLGIGTDYWSYVRIFEQLRHGHDVSQEPGWKALNLAVARGGLSAQWVFAASSFLAYVCLFLTRRKDLWIVVVVYFLYLYAYSWNAVRNAISIGFFWYSCICLQRGRTVRGFLWILLGALFHTSALLYVPVYALMRWARLTKRQTLAIAAVSYILFMRLHLASVLMNSSVVGLSRYAGYAASSKYGAATEGGERGLAVRWFCQFLSYCLCDEKSCPRRDFSAMSVLFLSLFFADILSMQIVIFSRVRTCFSVAWLVIFAQLFRTRSANAAREAGKWVALLGLFALFFTSVFLRGTHEIVPYTHVL